MTLDDDNAEEIRQLSELEEEMLATFALEIEALTAAAAEGKADVDIQLAALLAGAPDGVRAELMKRFRQLQQEQAQEQDAPQELTPEQEKELEIEQARERSKLALWLSEKTLKKIREAMLSNPLFLDQLMGIGEKLRKQGVLVEIENQQQREIGELSAQQTKAKDFQKDKEKEGRER